MTALELWAGVECSLVRVGDVYRNQIVETGHADRLADLDLLAGLGVKTLRYPMIWDMVAPEDPDQCDWRWTDERMSRLRQLGIRVIAGLVHHGSGPRHTHLLDPFFPEKLARFAGQAAARYPWIELWTPVNEPLTTARFSCLYGHWYPHHRDYASLLRATVIQCRAVALAMQAIRRVTPQAQLVQTEDIGRSFSTPMLAYQAAHENERRWLSLDLLTGRAPHGTDNGLGDHGVPDRDLAELRDGLGMPDMIGINHYLTSDRFLDERTELYPNLPIGGNGRHAYVDTEAVRVPEAEGHLGIGARLAEVWDRYRRPMAVTEAHNNCTREEQLRWFTDIWGAAQSLKASGADIRAVTLWSIFGAVDWASLLTRRDNQVEPGLFDFSGPAPRPTLVAQAVAQIAQRGHYHHPVLDTPGWWARDSRFLRGGECAPPTTARRVAAPLLITGATGTLGRAFSRICTQRGLDHILTSRAELDMTDPLAIDRAINCYRPWAVVNAAGFVRVAEAAALAEQCFAENALGPELLAKACARRDLPLITFSSDLVFDGAHDRPYLETDPTNPLCLYGQSKSAAEQRVSAAWDKSLIIRTSAFFGPWDRHNFVWMTLNRLYRGQAVIASDQDSVSPTYVPDLVHGTLNLLLDGENGIWHLANQGEVSWYDLAYDLARQAQLDVHLIRPGRTKPRRCTALSSGRGLLLPALDQALTAYRASTEIAWAA